MNVPDFSQAKWRKSSRSSSGPNCVEVAPVGGLTAVRDSKNPTGPMLTYPASSWMAFLRR